MQVDPPSKRKGTKPETKLQRAIVKELEKKGCFVQNITGSLYQSGLPDLLVIHPRLGTFWVEVKMPNGRVSQRQKNKFTNMAKHGAVIYILKSTDEIGLIYQKPNLESQLHRAGRASAGIMPKI